jgi:hypothetical protein
MIAPGADVIVTFSPPKVIGLNVLEFVNANVVRPAKVTTEFAFKLARLILLFVGTDISCKVITWHEATAGAIWEYSVQVHEFPVVVVVTALEEVVGLGVDVEVVVTELEEVVGLGVDVGVENVELELEDGWLDVEVGEAMKVVEVIIGAVFKHEQALDNLDGSLEHWVAYAGNAVVAVKITSVYVAQKLEASAEDLMRALKQLSWLQSRRPSWTLALAIVNIDTKVTENCIARNLMSRRALECQRRARPRPNNTVQASQGVDFIYKLPYQATMPYCREQNRRRLLRKNFS